MSAPAAIDYPARGGGVPWLSSMVRRRLFGQALLMPALVFALGMIVYPVARTLWMSVHNYNLSRPQRMNAFVGLEHYRALVEDPQFWNSIGVTLTYSLTVTALAYAIGLGLALLVNRRSLGTRIGRTLLSMPWALPGVVAAFAFLWMFDASFGVVNFVLLRLGIIDAPVAWLTTKWTAMTVISLVGIWKIVPFTMLTQLAGLQAIPSELYQAARVDGANRWQEFRTITWPALGHVRVVTVVLTGLVTFREFGQIYVISGGGPERSTETLSVNLYVEAFQGFHFGYASALGIVMLVISLVFTIVVVRLLRTDFH
ncbi:MAG: sugar ABC transporter permease [Burkholderiales bacterium]|nr:sugar ABC transporter permease [Burkholderiales bacterium]